MALQYRWMVFLCVLVVQCFTDDIYTKHMNNFIKVVEIIESENPGLGPLAVLRGLRKATGIDTPFIQHYLGPLSDTQSLVLKSTLTEYVHSVLNHQVVQNLEEGVVLTADGTTVALTPLLLGLEASLKSTSWPRVPGLYPLTLTKNLVLSFLHHSQAEPSTPSRLGPGGCWDNVTDPQVFTLSGVASLATDALINGGMDGVILGKHVAKPNKRLLTLSSLLRQYYTYQLDSAGLDAAPALISQLRRSSFRRLVSLASLKKQLARSLSIYRRFDEYRKKNKQNVEMDEGLKEFVHSYIDCPAIIPRCMWEAQPYRGTPTLLSLPLSFLYIHHTYGPSKPCLSFQQCSEDMRAMQRFHQDDRGWDDIGYRSPNLFQHDNAPVHTVSSMAGVEELECPAQSPDLNPTEHLCDKLVGWSCARPLHAISVPELTNVLVSFVAGSDGYIYEGRGWLWQGAHTKGHNSKGYGVSFIGDYMSSIPSQRTMDLVRNQLAKCATEGGRLVSNFTIHGHRQLVSTSCPGDALYSEINGWEHFGEVKH